MESLAATALPLAKVGYQKVAAKARCSLFKFMKTLNDCTDAETKQMKIKNYYRRQICRGDSVKEDMHDCFCDGETEARYSAI